MSSFAAQTTSDFPIPLFVDHDITVEVPSGRCVCPYHKEKVDTIQDALSCLDNIIISPKATITIEMTQSDKEYDTIKVNHRDGDRIRIVGNCNGLACSIYFKSGIAGIEVENGNKLGFIDNFNLYGSEEDKHNSNSNGVYANNNANIICGLNITVQNFFRGIHANNNSFILAKNVRSENNWYDGIYAINGSIIYADNSSSINNGGRGIVASRGSVVSAANAKVADDFEVGIYSLFNSMIMATGATVNNTKAFVPGGFGDGVYSTQSSSIEANDCQSNNNQRYGFVSSAASSLEAWGATATGNLKENFFADSRTFGYIGGH